MVSAFANRKAVQHLASYIVQAKSRGAEINIIVGVDLQSTTAEALREIISLGVDAKVFHSNLAWNTFHPKIYFFEAKEKAELLIGSNNLTEGGLFTNYEAATRTTYYFPEDENEYISAKKSLERYLNPSGVIVQPLTEELIETLIARGEVPTEKQAREIRKQTQTRIKTKKDAPKSPFGSEKLKHPPKPTKQFEFKKEKAKFKLPTLGRLVWQKSKLPASDVQRQIGNVTGGLRLTQAKWKDSEGMPINQTTYFRNDIMPPENWTCS
jgi:hypothetical protein